MVYVPCGGGQLRYLVPVVPEQVNKELAVLIGVEGARLFSSPVVVLLEPYQTSNLAPLMGLPVMLGQTQDGLHTVENADFLCVCGGRGEGVTARRKGGAGDG